MHLLPVLIVLLMRGASGRLRLSMGPSPYVTAGGKDVLLECLFYVDVPSLDISLLVTSWQLDGQLLVEYNESVTAYESRAHLCPDELKKGNASLALADPTDDDNGEYTCTVLYGEARRQGHIILRVEAGPQLSIENQVVVLHEFSELRCSIAGHYPSNITVEWLRDGHFLEGSRLYTAWNSLDTEPSLTSSYAFIPNEKDIHANFTCRVKHNSLTSHPEKTFGLILGARPTVHVQDGGWSKKRFLNFLCIVSGFYPPEISVQWTVNGQPVVLLTHARKSLNLHDGTYSLEESYLFEPLTRHNGGVFTCSVRHATIPGIASDSLKLIISPHLPDWVWYILGSVLLLVVLSNLRRRVGDIVSLNDWIDGGIITLDCSMKGRVPGNITALWVIKKQGQETEIRESKVNRWSEDYTELVNRDRYSCSSNLEKSGLCGMKRSFTSSLIFVVSKDEDDGAEFVCRFLSADKVLAEKYRVGLVLDNKTYYSISGIAVPKECVVGEMLILSCSLKGAFPQNTEVTWEKVNGQKRMTIQKNMGMEFTPGQNPTTPYQITENRSDNLLVTFLTFSPSLQDNESQFSCRFFDDGGRVNAERCSHGLHVVCAKERKPDFCLSADWGFESTNGDAQEESGV